MPSIAKNPCQSFCHKVNIPTNLKVKVHYRKTEFYCRNIFLSLHISHLSLMEGSLYLERQNQANIKYKVILQFNFYMQLL